MLALCLVGLALPPPFSDAAAPRDSAQVERWLTLDGVKGVGHIDWTCVAAKPRIRFVNVRTSARVRVFRGSVELLLDSILHPRFAIEMPLGRRVQRWRIKPLSESLPPPVNFRVRPLRDRRCAPPVVLHDFGHQP